MPHATVVPTVTTGDMLRAPDIDGKQEEVSPPNAASACGALLRLCSAGIPTAEQVQSGTIFSTVWQKEISEKPFAEIFGSLSRKISTDR